MSRRVAVLARDLLPHGLAHLVAEADGAVGHRVREEDPPAVLGHLHVVEVRPARLVDADRRAQEDVVLLEALRAHVPPPLDEVGLPLLQGPLELLVRREVDVVRDARVVDDG
jgi:hypothetical protein